MWKIAWGIVLGLLLWHCLPFIMALIAIFVGALFGHHVGR